MQTLERLKKKSEFQAFLQSLIQRQPKGPRGRDYQNDLSVHFLNFFFCFLMFVL